MDEAIKNRIILILAILAAILFISTIGSCKNAHQQRAARDREMTMRLDLEKEMAEFSKERGVLKGKLDKLETDSQEVKGALEKAQSDNEALQDELQKMTKLKEALEEDLKDALVTKNKTDR